MAYKAFIKHYDYTIDDDGRFHSKEDGQFVNKHPSADIMTNDQISRANRRATLIANYEKYYPSTAKKVSGDLGSISGSLNNAANNVRQVKIKDKKAPRIDLSNISDEELRKILNREQMERQYDSLFNTPTESKGQKFVNNLAVGLSIAGTIAGIAGAAASIYSIFGGGKKKDTITNV